ncbi:rod shape-determining protein MreC [Roseateles sp.]|uniref:rod shape-determining protein MreC n=1 Tax=Roseateles sp. TaxID=1971397 RepID=UPI00395771E5
MPLGTLDRTPPPFFRQGPSALTKLALCSALALLLMVGDARFQLMSPVRSAFAIVLHPLQRLMLTPVDAWESLAGRFRGAEAAMAAEDKALRQLAQQAERLSRVQQLQAENERLRRLLELRPATSVPSQTAEVLFEAPDPFSRRVVIDRGATQGVVAGSPVINEAGVLGQVTRVYPLSSEVTLLSDREAAIPLLNQRTQMRNAAQGRADGSGMELRFLAANADIKVGDVMTTSGLDGIYPPGLPVAVVAAVERRGDSSFAQVQLAPLANADAARHVLVLQPLDRAQAARKEADAAAADEAASAAAAKAARQSAKKAEKAAPKASGVTP